MFEEARDGFKAISEGRKMGDSGGEGGRGGAGEGVTVEEGEKVVAEERAGSGDVGDDQGGRGTDAAESGGKGGRCGLGRCSRIRSWRWSWIRGGGVTTIWVFETERCRRTWAGRGRLRGQGRGVYWWCREGSRRGGRFAAFGSTRLRDGSGVGADITKGCQEFGVVLRVCGGEKEEGRKVGAKEGREC